MKARSKYLMVCAAMLGFVIVVFAVFDLGGLRGGGARTGPHGATKGEGVASGNRTDAGAVRPSDTAGAPRDAGARGVVRRFADQAARARLLEAVARARRARAQREAASAEGDPAAPAPGDVPSLDPSYIREVVRDAVPLLAECYELARETAPDLAGRIVVGFTIAGEPEVGGLVEEVELDADAPDAGSPLARHPVMAECLRETVLSLEFTPPADGGKVVVNYPLVFSNEPDSGD